MKTLKNLQKLKPNPLFDINEIVDLNGVEGLVESIEYSVIDYKYYYSLYSINENGNSVLHTHVCEDKLTKIDNKEDINLTISGFTNKAQAEEFINWYVGQGEQDSEIWFECRQDEEVLDVSSMYCNCDTTFPLTWNENTINMEIKPTV